MLRALTSRFTKMDIFSRWRPASGFACLVGGVAGVALCCPVFHLKHSQNFKVTGKEKKAKEKQGPLRTPSLPPASLPARVPVGGAERRGSWGLHSSDCPGGPHISLSARVSWVPLVFKAPLLLPLLLSFLPAQLSLQRTVTLSLLCIVLSSPCMFVFHEDVGPSSYSTCLLHQLDTSEEPPGCWLKLQVSRTHSRVRMDWRVEMGMCVVVKAQSDDQAHVGICPKVAGLSSQCF